MFNMWKYNSKLIHADHKEHKYLKKMNGRYFYTIDEIKAYGSRDLNKTKNEASNFVKEGIKGSYKEAEHDAEHVKTQNDRLLERISEKQERLTKEAADRAKNVTKKTVGSLDNIEDKEEKKTKTKAAAKKGVQAAKKYNNIILPKGSSGSGGSGSSSGGEIKVQEVGKSGISGKTLTTNSNKQNDNTKSRSEGMTIAEKVSKAAKSRQ